ncbi:RiPP maturation radical SAM C-methyltransferase [Streptomyces sp. NPDC058401]|uniref:RiPP maturation radical SAM C-methyltransferase n=1 Tax=Streptomyces sp. NPDC058401 TaxID=3346480 RepID=UPI0036631FA0
MRVLLVNMPWAALDHPSLALGVLKQTSDRWRFGHDVDVLCANMLWAEYCMERDPKLTPSSYTEVGDEGFMVGLGEWVFAEALSGTVRPDGGRAYLDRAAELGADVAIAAAYAEHANGFIDMLAAQITATGYDLVGFTSTFAQNVASLALAKRLKGLAPRILTVMGGANCDDVQGAAIFRNHPFLDFVVRGEGEDAFGALLDGIEAPGSQALDLVPGLCRRTPEGPRITAMRRSLTPVSKVPEPDFDHYFDFLATSPLAAFIEPKLVLESSRGCWWGEKHHCTFCGLNGSGMAFRSKDADRMAETVLRMVERHQVLDIVMADNIIDMGYFTSFLPRLADTGWDLRIHYEIKSNLRVEHLDALAAARVNHVQPGIESLSSRVLNLMDKGVSGAQNIRLLREGEERNLTMSWNYLYGFPGERDADYQAMIDQFPALVHLQPPGGGSRLALERFSPNFDRPEIGFSNRRPAWYYHHIYELPDAELRDLVYMYDSDPEGIGPALERSLHEALEIWRSAYAASSLTWRRTADGVNVEDRRSGWPPRTIPMGNPEAEAFTELLRPRRLTALSPSALSFLSSWRSQGLVFEDDGWLVALPTRAERVPWKIGGSLTPTTTNGAPA